jgi:hypothetical protein
LTSQYPLLPIRSMEIRCHPLNDPASSTWPAAGSYRTNRLLHRGGPEAEKTLKSISTAAVNPAVANPRGLKKRFKPSQTDGRQGLLAELSGHA